MPIISPSLDLILALTCLWIAYSAVRSQNDFFFSGCLWLAAAAFFGALKLAGFSQVQETHAWLTDVGRGPGTLAMGLGILAGLYRPARDFRWIAHAWAILGAGATLQFSQQPWLGSVNLAFGVVLLISLGLLSARHLKLGNPLMAGAALGSAALLAFIGFGLSRLPFSNESILKPVDVLHVLLIAAYSLMGTSLQAVTRQLVNRSGPFDKI